MPDTLQISPLLDGFQLGQAFSSHDGVSCYAALKTATGERFILKQLSIPASQTKVDALLITGACKTEQQVRDYFQSVLEDTTQDLETLEQLSAKPGFTSFTGWQCQPKEGQVGFDVYMLSPYSTSLASRMAKGPITHLEAVNLGLDICAALSICRSAGYLYQDLKPENIYITPQGRFTIGDLGFLSTDNLAYATIPDRYLGQYAAPELRDMLSAPNLSIDLYALGMILYHIYNGGAPFCDESSPEGAEKRRLSGEALPAPAYADYEMAEIIQKACALKPEDRWVTPDEMAQALTAYMQRNAISDNPIAPPIITDPPVSPEDQEEAEAELAEEMVLESADAEPEAPTEPDAPAAQEDPEDDYADEEGEDEEIDILPILRMPDRPKPAPAPEPEPEPEPAPEPEPDGEDEEEELDGFQPEVPQPEAPVDWDEEDGEEDEDAEEHSVDLDLHFDLSNESEDASQPEPEADDLSAELLKLTDDETAPSEETIEGLDLELDEDLAKMLAHADELAQHNADLPTVTVPETSHTEEDNEAAASSGETEDAEVSEEEPPKKTKSAEKKSSRWVGVVIGLLVAAILAAAAYLFYNFYYLVPVSSLQVTETGADRFAVTLTSTADDDTFHLVCTDNYGNSYTAMLDGHTAVFENLKPGTQYTVKVTPNGFHKLTGYTSVTYSTGVETEFLQMTAVTGSEDGSVIINFTVDGSDPNSWFITATADGVTSEPLAFTGHTATLTGLEVGKTYTFTIKPDSDAFISGSNTLTFTPRAVVTAQNLRLTGISGQNLTIAWDLPQEEVTQWTVHYKQENGLNQEYTVTEPTAVLEGVDTSLPCTVEVTAAEMSKAATLSIPAYPVVVTSAEVAAEASENGGYTLTWAYEGDEPVGGWTVLYVCGEDEATRKSVDTAENTVTLTEMLPGTSYRFTIQTYDGSCVFADAASLEVPQAAAMDQYKVTPEGVTMELYRTPTEEELADQAFTASFTTSFTTGQSVTFLMTCAELKQTDEDAQILLLVRSDSGVPVFAETTTQNWADLWDRKNQATMTLGWNCETAGTFTLEVYVNGQLMKTANFTISAE